MVLATWWKEMRRANIERWQRRGGSACVIWPVSKTMHTCAWHASRSATRQCCCYFALELCVCFLPYLPLSVFFSPSVSLPTLFSLCLVLSLLLSPSLPPPLFVYRCFYVNRSGLIREGKGVKVQTVDWKLIVRAKGWLHWWIRGLAQYAGGGAEQGGRSVILLAQWVTDKLSDRAMHLWQCAS